MPAPIDYGVQIADPTQAFLGAFQTGASIREAGLKQEQQTQQMAQQKLIQDGFAKLRGPNATAADYANLSMMLPETQAQSIRKSFEMLSGERQQAALQESGQIFAAFKAKKPEIAINYIDKKIEAKRTSGDEAGAKFLETWRDVAKENPQATEDYFGFITSQMPGGKDVISSAISLSEESRAAGKGPAELREALAKASEAESKALVALRTETDDIAKAKALRRYEEAKADKEAVQAEFEQANQVLGVQQKGATLRKTEADILIDKENARIAGLNAAAAKETNVLKRQELKQKIDEATEKRDATDRDQRATVANQVADVDNFLNTAARILQTPENIIKSATGPVTAILPTFSQDVADFEALVEALGSQAFIAQIPKIKGTGALSEKEGDKLQASLQTLSLKQSPARLKENVTEAVRLLTKVRENISLKYGVQAPPFDVPARQEVFVTLPDGTRAKFPNQAAADNFKKKAGIQ
jgi:hypothetical protein